MSLKSALKPRATMEMEIDVNKIESILEDAGFLKTKHEIYLKEIDRGELSEWGVVTPESKGVLVSLGAVSPNVNKFAFGLLRKISQNRIKPQFPAYVGPPILVLESKSIPIGDVARELPTLVKNFENRVEKYTIDDWFRKAGEVSPYGPTQSIILPAYYYLKSDKSSLLDYLSQRHLANPAQDVESYFCALEELATQLGDPRAR